MPARGGVREAIGRLNEAGKIYDKKKAGALLSSCILRLASVHASFHRGGGVRWGSRVDVFESLWRAEAAAEGLPLTDRIAVIGSCAALAGRIGCWRRMAASVSEPVIYRLCGIISTKFSSPRDAGFLGLDFPLNKSLLNAPPQTKVSCGSKPESWSASLIQTPPQVRKAAQVFAAAGQWQQAHQAMVVCAGFYQLNVSGLEPSFEVRFGPKFGGASLHPRMEDFSCRTREIQFQSDALRISPPSDAAPRKSQFVTLMNFVP
jgi:hypothetical protein